LIYLLLEEEVVVEVVFLVGVVQEVLCIGQDFV
jgi:hypothetical protein